MPLRRRPASAPSRHAAPLWGIAAVAAVILGSLAPAWRVAAAPPPPLLDWMIDRAASRVSFTLTGPNASPAAQAGGPPTAAAGGGAPVQGVFKRWQAHAAFDPKRAAAGRLALSLDTASLVTGSPTRDQALTGPQALAAARFPRIVFTSRTITPRPQGGYAVEGRLEVRGVARPAVATLTAPPGRTSRLDVELALPTDVFAAPGRPRPDAATLSVRLAARY